MLLDGILCRVACFRVSLGRFFLKNMFVSLSMWYIYSSVGLGRGLHVDRQQGAAQLQQAPGVPSEELQ
jgi:hypothetical protein